MATKRVYWDSCAWLGLINSEEDKVEGCQYIMQEAIRKNVEILVSTVTLAEVFKTRCAEPYKMLAEEKDIAFEEFFDQDFIIKASVDEDIAKRARGLLRYYASQGLKKPMDAIHLATALKFNAAEMHTFDGSDLLCLDGKIQSDSGVILKICKPPLPPISPLLEIIEATLSQAERPQKGFQPAEEDVVTQ